MQNVRIIKAHKLLRDAKVLMKNGCFESCISRCYYCIFHTAFALLVKFNISVEAREHRFVLSAFPREFIHRRKLFANKVGDFLQSIYRARSQADYEFIEFSEKYTKRLLDKTEQIYNDILKVCNDEKQQRT